MSIESIISILKTAGFSAFYEYAPDDTPLPFVVLRDVTHPNFFADNVTLVPTTTLELVYVEAEAHNWANITTLETTLTNAGLAFSSEDIRISDENIVEMVYTITFVGGNLS